MNVVAFEISPEDGLPRVPPDILQSARVFNATCGPISFAAVLGTFVCEVMRYFPEFPQRHHTTAGDMVYALKSCGAEFAHVGDQLPHTGIALIQLEGPWTNPGAPIAAQLSYTHWVGVRGDFVFDPNLEDWIERDEWLNRGAAQWMSGVKRCSGFRVRDGYSVVPRPFQFWPYGRVPEKQRRQSTRR